MPSASGRCSGSRFARDWLPVIVILAATFVASSIPGQRLPEMASWNVDKILHGVEFAILGVLLARALGRTAWGARPWVVVLAAAVLASAWGGIDEIHQLFTPRRASDWRDWLADTTGGLVGALAHQLAVRVRGAGRAPAIAADRGEAAP